jgi:iron complex transport system permease protein
MRTLRPARYLSYWITGILALAATMAICLYVGPGDKERAVWFGYPVQWELMEARWLRLITAGLCGWALAASGVALQALLRNALADPYVLGISSGGTLGVMGWLLATWSLRRSPQFSSDSFVGTLLQAGSTLPAIAGAGLTCIVVYVLARGRAGGPMDPLKLLLVGVVISAICGALIMLLNQFAPGGVKTDLMRYMMGVVSEEWTRSGLTIALAIIMLAWLPLVFSAKSLNVSTLSDIEVASLGVKLGSLRTMAFICAAIMTAISIALAGPIGFVGLICPHVCRRLFGADHRQLIVTAPFFGAIVLMLTDSFVRCTLLLFNGELPVGVITALAGGPFFLVLLLSRGRGAEGVDDGR